MSAFIRFEIDEVVVPARMEMIAPFAAGNWDRVPIILVRGFTEEGCEALGEAGRGVPRQVVDATLQTLLRRDLRSIHPASVWEGESPKPLLPGIFPSGSLDRRNPSQSLVETLWLDAVGKLSGLPAHALLGGKIRDGVRVDAWANRPPAKALTALVTKAAAAGYTGLKLKCSAAGDTILALTEIADEVPPGFGFTIDPMCALRTFNESARLLERLAQLPFPVRLEDPFPHDAPLQWQRIRQLFPIPLIWHARSLEQVRFGLREGLADGFNIAGDPAFGFVAASGMVAGSALHCWHGASLEMGIMQAARLHACSVAAACELASDLSSHWVREHTLLANHPPVRRGCMTVPDEPGLGVHLDDKAIVRYRVARWVVE